MCHHSAKSIYLIADQAPSRNDIEATITFGVAKDDFLRATPIVEEDDSFGLFVFVGYDNFVIVIKITRLQQV